MSREVREGLSEAVRLMLDADREVDGTETYTITATTEFRVPRDVLTRYVREMTGRSYDLMKINKVMFLGIPLVESAEVSRGCVLLHSNGLEVTVALKKTPSSNQSAHNTPE